MKTASHVKQTTQENQQIVAKMALFTKFHVTNVQLFTSERAPEMLIVGVRSISKTVKQTKIAQSCNDPHSYIINMTQIDQHTL